MVGNGYLVVSRITGLHTTQLDVFDPDGRYVYKLKLPENMKDMEPRFHGDRLCGIKTVEDRSIYEVYRVTNLPEFSKNNKTQKNGLLIGGV